MYSRASLIAILGLTLCASAQISLNIHKDKAKPDLPETLVIRFHKETNKMEFYESKEPLKSVEDPTIAEKEFKEVSVKMKKPEHELDRDSSTASGYGFYGGYYGGGYSWGFNYYYYPAYYPYYSYYPYYPVYPSYYCCSPTYYYGGYSYYYQPYYYYPYANHYYYYYGYRY